ncbi:LysR family transcriptional regulator [Nonomuraea sp. NPDC048826]|uniref:LysR family transcriptional regulator n=1 Tax=Nonomuraea sp. NPDC048826 TaxID=3364347 RepID=UPI003724AEC7
MELRDIEIFLTLAEELHFGRTAERLHLTQARVSQSIKKQERRFGAALFNRTNRYVQLTEFGEQLRTDLVPGYRLIQHSVSHALARGQGLTGMLRVGFSTVWCGRLVLEAADAFQAEHPNCQVEIREVPLHDRFGALRAGQRDIQLTELPGEESDIVNGPVFFSHPRALVVPAGHRLAAEKTVSLEDLAGQPLIPLSGPPQYFADYHFPSHTPSGRPIARGPSAMVWEDAMNLVLAGRGVFPASAEAATYYARPGLAFVPFRDAPPVEYGLFWLADGESPKVQAFIKTLVEKLSATESQSRRAAGP